MLVVISISAEAINIANIQFRRGNSDEGEAILLGLLEDPEITGDAYAYNLVLRLPSPLWTHRPTL